MSAAPTSETDLGICGIGTDITGGTEEVNLNTLTSPLEVTDSNCVFLIIRHLREACEHVVPGVTQPDAHPNQVLTYSTLESTLYTMHTQLNLLPMDRQTAMVGGEGTYTEALRKFIDDNTAERLLNKYLPILSQIFNHRTKIQLADIVNLQIIQGLKETVMHNDSDSDKITLLKNYLQNLLVLLKDFNSRQAFNEIGLNEDYSKATELYKDKIKLGIGKIIETVLQYFNKNFGKLDINNIPSEPIEAIIGKKNDTSSYDGIFPSFKTIKTQFSIQPYSDDYNIDKYNLTYLTTYLQKTFPIAPLDTPAAPATDASTDDIECDITRTAGRLNEQLSSILKAYDLEIYNKVDFYNAINTFVGDDLGKEFKDEDLDKFLTENDVQFEDDATKGRANRILQNKKIDIKRKKLYLFSHLKNNYNKNRSEDEKIATSRGISPYLEVEEKNGIDAITNIINELRTVLDASKIDNTEYIASVLIQRYIKDTDGDKIDKIKALCLKPDNSNSEFIQLNAESIDTYVLNKESITEAELCTFMTELLEKIKSSNASFEQPTPPLTEPNNKDNCEEYIKSLTKVLTLLITKDYLNYEPTYKIDSESVNTLEQNITTYRLTNTDKKNKKEIVYYLIKRFLIDTRDSSTIQQKIKELCLYTQGNKIEPSEFVSYLKETYNLTIETTSILPDNVEMNTLCDFIKILHNIINGGILYPTQRDDRDRFNPNVQVIAYKQSPDANCYQNNVQTLLLTLAYIKYLKEPPPTGINFPIKAFLTILRDYFKSDLTSAKQDRQLYLNLKQFLGTLQLTPTAFSKGTQPSLYGPSGDTGTTPTTVAADALGDALQMMNPGRYALLQAIRGNPKAYQDFMAAMRGQEASEAALMKRLEDLERALVTLKNQPNFSTASDPTGSKFAIFINELIKLSGFDGLIVAASSLTQSGGDGNATPIGNAYKDNPQPPLERPPTTHTPILSAVGSSTPIPTKPSPYTPILNHVRGQRSPSFQMPPSTITTVKQLKQTPDATTLRTNSEINVEPIASTPEQKSDIIDQILKTLTSKIPDDTNKEKILSFVRSYSALFPEGFDMSDTEFESRVYGVIKTKIEESIGNIPDSGNLKTNLNTALGKTPLNQTTFLQIIDAYQPLMDSVSKVRIILNYRTDFNVRDSSGNVITPTDKTTTAQGNFKTIYPKEDGKSPTEKTFVPIQNLVEIPSSSGNVGIGTSTIIRPFYQVLNSDTIKEYDVDKDLKLLNETDKSYHLLYSAYGFSGSGKTFSMFDGEKGLLGRLLNGLAGKNIQYRIYDYYGEKPDDQEAESKTKQVCKTPDSKWVNPRTTYYNKKDYVTLNRIDNSTNLSKDIEAFNQLRRLDWSSFTGDEITNDSIKDNLNKTLASYAQDGAETSTEFHIRATPNNPDSSRSHLFVDIKIDDKHRITLMDMAGAENVDAIQQMYFVEKEKLDVEKFNNGINAMAAAIFTTLTSGSKQNYNSSGNAIKVLYPLNSEASYNTQELFKLTNEDLFDALQYKILLIKPKAWASIFNIQDTGTNDFIKNYNRYQYIRLLIPIYKLVYILKEVISAIIPASTNQDNSVNDTITAFEKFNENLGFLHLKPIGNIKNIPEKGTSNKKPLSTYLNIINDHIKYYYENLLKFYIDVIPFNDGETVDEEINNLNGIINKKNVNTSNFNDIYKTVLDKIKTKIEGWDINYIKNIHCPLRFQGNFIMNTLEDMKNTVRGLTDKSDTSQTILKGFPYDILYPKDASASASPLPTHHKVMLFVNTRLDFDPNATDEDNKRMQDAYRNALTFAIQMNPLIPDSDPIKNAANEYKATGGAKPESALPDSVKPGGAALSDSVKPSIQYAPKFIEGIFNMKGGAPNDTPMGTPAGTAETPLTAPANIAATPTLVPGANPSAAMENAKTKTKKLNELTKTLIEVKNNLDGLEGSITQFKKFKKSVMTDDGEKITPTTETEKNDAVGAYNYLDAEGKKLNENFDAKVKSLITSLEKVQKDLVELLEAEASTPTIRNNLIDITKIFEQNIEGFSDEKKDNTGLINSLKTLQQTFASDYETAFGYAKQLAVPIIAQRKLEAERLKANPALAAELQNVQDIYNNKKIEFNKLKSDNQYDNITKLTPLNDDKKKQVETFKKLFSELEEILESINLQQRTTQANGRKEFFDKFVENNKETIEKLKDEILEEANKGGRGRHQEGGKLETEQLLKIIKEGIEKIQGIVKRLTTVYSRQSTPGFALSTTDNLFSRILNEYLNTRTDETEMESRNRFMEQLEVNHLIPRKVLAITTMDRVIFVFITLFIRTFATAVMIYLIERNTITSMKIAITGYMILYSLTLLAFVMLVNLDMYRMRIIFNYVNFHANASKVYLHLGLLVVIGILIYIVITKINFPIRSVSPKAISDNQKVRLIMRFQILTGILWAILALIVALESA